MPFFRQGRIWRRSPELVDSNLDPVTKLEFHGLRYSIYVKTLCAEEAGRSPALNRKLHKPPTGDSGG